MSTDEVARPLSKAAARGPASRFLRKYALQLGIVGVAIFVWVLFLIGSPRTFLSGDIYVSFMSTTPVLRPDRHPAHPGDHHRRDRPLLRLGHGLRDDGLRRRLRRHGKRLARASSPASLAGLLAGLLNGFIVVKIGVPSLVATIGTQFLLRGVVLVVTNGQGLGMTEVQSTRPARRRWWAGPSGRDPDAVLLDDRRRPRRLVLPQPAPLRRARLPHGRQHRERTAHGRERRTDEDHHLRRRRARGGVRRVRRERGSALLLADPR